MEHIVTGYAHAAERQQYPAFRAQFQDYMRAHVGSPDIVLGIHSHHVSRDEQVVGKAVDEFARRIKFHQRVLAAMKDIDVSLGVYGDSGGLDKMLVGRKLEEVRD